MGVPVLMQDVMFRIRCYQDYLQSSTRNIKPCWCPQPPPKAPKTQQGIVCVCDICSLDCLWDICMCRVSILERSHNFWYMLMLMGWNINQMEWSAKAVAGVLVAGKHCSLIASLVCSSLEQVKLLLDCSDQVSHVVCMHVLLLLSARYCQYRSGCAAIFIRA